MVTAYLDDSGNRNLAVVAGYVGSVAQWERYVPEWSKALRAQQVNVVHRASIESFWGEFTEERGWNPERRTAFVKRLHQIIKHRTYTGFGVAVNKADFEAAVPEAMRRLIGGPYGWCAHECIAALRIWSDTCRQHSPIEWIFEAGTPGSGQIGMMMQALYEDEQQRRDFLIGGWSFRDKSLTPLQSADVIAYEVFKLAQNEILDGRQRPVRKSAHDLFRVSDMKLLRYRDKPYLLNWISNWQKKYGPLV